MRTSSSKDFAYAMTPFKILSWPVGTWPLQDYNVFSAIRVTVTAFIVSLMIVLVQTELYFDSSDAEKTLDAVVLVTCGILAVSKVMCFHIWPEGLVCNFNSAVIDYDELSDEEKRVIMRKHAYMARIAGAGVIAFSCFSATLFVIQSMFAGKKEEEQAANVTEKSAAFPVPSEHVMDIINMPESLYFLIYIGQYIMLLLTATGNLGSDALFFGIIFHLCGQVKILRLEFTRLVNENKRTAERFKILTKRHVYLLKLANMLNKTISSILVVQLFMSCLLICTTGFQLILALNVGNIILTFKMFAIINTVWVQLYAYSFVGEYLRRQMEGIGNSVYFCNWYDLPKCLARDIIKVITRAQTPVHLTAGKFFVIDIETYMSTIKTSMSYLSVLRVMINT